jgi:hypothetical protein
MRETTRWETPAGATVELAHLTGTQRKHDDRLRDGGGFDGWELHVRHPSGVTLTRIPLPYLEHRDPELAALAELRLAEGLAAIDAEPVGTAA